MLPVVLRNARCQNCGFSPSLLPSYAQLVGGHDPQSQPHFAVPASTLCPQAAPIFLGRRSDSSYVLAENVSLVSD